MVGQTHGERIPAATPHYRAGQLNFSCGLTRRHWNLIKQKSGVSGGGARTFLSAAIPKFQRVAIVTWIATPYLAADRNVRAPPASPDCQKNHCLLPSSNH